MFVVVDGIDGSGKGTIVNALAERRRQEGARVFDLREFTKREHRLPEVTELGGVDVIISAEPTHAWIGAAIREELVRESERHYSAIRTAEAFALDRFILYRRVLLPARDRGIDVIQERSVTSSLVYQPIQREPVPIETVIALEGNAFTLGHPPDCCLIASTEPARALQRLQLRGEKRDEAIFEKLPMLERLHERYHAPWFRELLSPHGWTVAYVDANGAVEDAVARASQLVLSRAKDLRELAHTQIITENIPSSTAL